MFCHALGYVQLYLVSALFWLLNYIKIISLLLLYYYSFKRKWLHARVLDDVVLVTWGSPQVKAHVLGRWDRCSAPSAMTLYTNSHERNKKKT